jgi:hypothetical protein
MREYKDGDMMGFCIFNFAVKPKKGDWPAATCDNLIDHLIKRFKEVYGFPPTHIKVPEDYTGRESIDDIEIERDGKPAGHYYAYITTNGR